MNKSIISYLFVDAAHGFNLRLLRVEQKVGLKRRPRLLFRLHIHQIATL
jgi:hypothetical protein